MSKPITLSAPVVGGLRLAAGLSALVPDDDQSIADELVGELAHALHALADAGGPSSDGGRVLTRAEAAAILSDLIDGLQALQADAQ